METLARIFKDQALRRKILVVLGFLVVFRIAAAIPIPGIDASRLRQFFGGGNLGQFFGLLNLFTGGSLDNLSIVMLGVGPYITATIIMQLLTMIFPALKNLYHEEGEAGRKRFMQYSRLLTIPLALLQGYGLMTLLARQGIIPPLELSSTIINLVVVTAGSVLLMWIGELIGEYGIGNGVSIIIFAGIVAGMPQTIGQALTAFDASQIPVVIGFLIAAVAVVAAVVVVTQGERPVPVSYAKRVRGMKLYGGLATYLPLRVNQAGVIPIIFALSILLFPQMFAGIFAASSNAILQRVSTFFVTMLSTLWIYGALYFILVFLFTYFYTAVTFDPEAIATNLQKGGGFIPGMRPGRPTAEYLASVVHRITLVGALFLGAIAVLPIVMQGFTGAEFLTIGGTALLIVVSVVLETIKQIQAQLSVREYD